MAKNESDAKDFSPSPSETGTTTGAEPGAATSSTIGAATSSATGSRTGSRTGTADATSRGPVRRNDLIASILLILVAVIVNIVITGMALFLVMLTDSCNVTCNYTVIQGGLLFAVLAPSVLTVIGIFITIFRVVRRLLAFWVPLAR
jgi:hypothetical protein